MLHTTQEHRAALANNEPLTPGRSPLVPRAELTRTVLLVSGMRGAGCREHIASALEAVSGVREASVSLFRARASVLHDATCAASDLVRAIVNAGYGARLPGGEHGGHPGSHGDRS